MIDTLLAGAIIPLETWLLFVLMWIGFTAFPGPNAAYAMACGARRGSIGAVAAAAGFSTGVACYVILVGCGLIAFLAASAELFEVMRWVGAAYLGYLAWRSWHAPTTAIEQPNIGKREAGGIWFRAALITLTNPKSAISYIVVYPPFMSGGLSGAHDAGAIAQLFVLGTTSIVLSFIIYTTYGLLAGRLGRLIKNRRQAMIRNRTFALIFASAGVALAWTGRR